MKKSILWVAVLIVCIGLFVSIYFLYGNLKDEYAPDPFENQQETGEQTTKDTQDESETEGESEETDYSAPDFSMLDTEGNKVNLSDFIGKPIVLNFWASWCYYCKEEMPHFEEAYKEYEDVQFLMVNLTDGVRETVDIGKEYISSSGYTFPVYFDTENSSLPLYGTYSLPMTFFIDKDGNLVVYAQGMLSKENLIKGIEMIR